MAFVVIGCTGKYGEYWEWLVGTAQKEEAAQAAVSRLTEVAKHHRVSTPEPLPDGFRLQHERLDVAKAALAEAGDPGTKHIDCFTGVEYTYKEVQSFD